jgi:hypothetical protein
MYLMDEIAEATQKLLRGGFKVDHPAVSVFPTLTERLKGIPRFLFDEAAINTAVEITLGRPKIILDALSSVRVPYPAMWVEWPESGRERLRAEFEGLITDARPLPSRVGFLLEADQGGRSGTATWVWNGGLGPDTPPNVGPISPFFNLDHHFHFQPREGFLRGNLAQIWLGNAVQEKALLDIWHTAEHRLSDWGVAYCNFYGIKSLEWMFADVYGEYIMIWAIILMLTSSRKVIDYRPVDRSKINHIRSRKSKTPLLDHTEVILHINSSLNGIGQRRQPLGYSRKSPRIHMVSSFLNHRGNKHWIVQPFLRGSGETIHRQVKVRL